MGIGASIFMICVGAVMVFALRGPLPYLDWIDLDVVGLVLMIGGVIGLIVTLTLSTNNRRTSRVYDQRHTGPPPPY